MKFFRKPPLGTVRKKFSWLPHKGMLLEYEYRPIEGAEKVRFHPGWVDNGPSGIGPVMGIPAAPAMAWPPRHVKPAHCGGWVVPVRHECNAQRDYWVWLEYRLEELVPIQHRHRDEPTSEWRPTLHRKQWNLWHEYY